MATVAELLAGFTPEVRLSGERLLASYLTRRRSWLYAHADFAVDQLTADRLQRDLERVRGGQPLAYLLGQWEFYSLDLTVTADTLVPRPETEQLVDVALAALPVGQAADVVDLGTGSGAIALALAHERPLARITAVDISAAALKVARGNAQNLKLDRVVFVEGSWWEPLAKCTFDLVISNPPYVVPGDPRLSARGEPDLALYGGDDGLDAYRAIALGLGQHLRPGGQLLLEHGLDQREALLDLFRGQFSALQCLNDFAGHPRILAGQHFLAGSAG